MNAISFKALLHQSNSFQSKYEGVCAYTGVRYKMYDRIHYTEESYVSAKVLSMLEASNAGDGKTGYCVHYALDIPRVQEDLSKGHEVTMYTKTGSKTTYVMGKKGICKPGREWDPISEKQFLSRLKKAVFIVTSERALFEW